MAASTCRARLAVGSDWKGDWSQPLCLETFQHKGSNISE